MRGTALVSLEVASRRVTVLGRGSFFGWSFAPDGRTVVYARNRPGGDLLHGKTNLFSVPAAGGRPRTLTHDGRSAYPVWGRGKIAFVHVRRGRAQPSFDLWLLDPSSGRVHRLARASGAYGLAPVAWSQNGAKLLAANRGESTATPVAVDPANGRTRPIGRYTGLRAVVGGLSRDGRWVLVAAAPGDSPADERVERIAYAGGRPRVIARNAAEPSWNS